jgi:transposase
MGDLSNFERGQIVGSRLAGASVTRTATLLGVSRATASKVMTIYTNHGNTTSAKRNSERKSSLTESSSYIEKDCSKKSRNYCNTGGRTAELNIHPVDPVTTNTV